MREKEIWEDVAAWQEQHQNLMVIFDADPNAGENDIHREQEQHLFRSAWESSGVRPSDIVEALDEADDHLFFQKWRLCGER